jgi:hypothetical protein
MKNSQEALLATNFAQDKGLTVATCCDKCWLLRTTYDHVGRYPYHVESDFLIGQVPLQGPLKFRDSSTTGQDVHVRVATHSDVCCPFGFLLCDEPRTCTPMVSQ